MRPLVKNAADKKQVKTAGTKSQLRKRQQLEDLKALLNQPEFRRFIWDVLSRCKLFSSSYDANPNAVYFNEGARNIGLQLMVEINQANPNYLTEMMAFFQKAEGIEEDDNGSNTDNATSGSAEDATD